MAKADPLKELEALRELLRQKDATIANLQQQVAELGEKPEEDETVSDIGSPPLASPILESNRSKTTPRSPITHSKSDIEPPRSTFSVHNPFAHAARSATAAKVSGAETSSSATSSIFSSSTSAMPPITPITSNHGSPIISSPVIPQTHLSLSPNSSRRRTIAPGQLANLQAQLNNMRRSTSVSVNDHEQSQNATPPLLAAPSSELDWSDDNPFAFLKTPAPAPPSSSSSSSTTSSSGISNHHQKGVSMMAGNGSGFVHHQHTHSSHHAPASRLVPTDINSSGETIPARKRPRSHSSSMKVRFELMEPPPPLIPPELPLEMTNLTPAQSHSLQIIQAYFRGRIERAKVKHMVEKQVMGRRFTMEEILLSERRYVHHLDLIVNLFLRPLQKTDILTPAEITAIFMNVEKLHQMARSFLSKLEELFTEDPLVIGHRVGLLFLNTIPEWRAYSYLVNHFEGAQVQLTKCKERRSFREWMHKAESHPSMEKLGMMDYMIAAAKRVPQYQLLLKAVKKNTPKASRHYETIKTAKAMIGELAQFLNDRKRSFDNMRKIELIQRSLNGKIPKLMTTGREFVAEAVVKEEDANARLIIDRRIYLFNDSLLVATASNNKFDRLIYLTGAEMSTKSARKLILRVEEVMLSIVFQSEPEKNRWVALVGHAIETLAFQEQSSILKDFAPTGISKPKVLNSVILHQGYLLKHRRSSGGWNKRWFLLEQGILYYVKNPTKIEETTARGTIDLGAYSIRSPLDWTSGGKKRHGFELVSRTRPVFVLASEDPRSRDEWVHALKPFLQSTKPNERDGVLYAASTSSDIARTASSSRVLLPTYKPSPSLDVDDDLIQWSSDPNDASSSGLGGAMSASTGGIPTSGSQFSSAAAAPTSSSSNPLAASNKFYFNEDYMDRATATEPDPDWFTSVSALSSPPSSQKTHPLRRSISSSSVTSS